MSTYIVCITGSSGVIYGLRLLRELKRWSPGSKVYAVVSNAAKLVMRYEVDERDVEESLRHADKVYSEHDIDADIASGSTMFDAVVIAPCSMKTLSLISHGITINLIARVADVALKERRKLVLLLRETPLSLIHLKNMVRAAQAGAIIMPACPAFYHKPKSVDDVINYVVGRVLDVLRIRHELFKRWDQVRREYMTTKTYDDERVGDDMHIA